MKIKVLIFIDWYLPGYKAGGPIQSVANMVAHLKDEFEFSIITRNTDYCETQPYQGIKSNEWNLLEDGTKVYYLSQDQLTNANIRTLIRKQDFDEVYLNGIYSLYSTLLPLYYLRKKHNKRIIIAVRGMLSDGSMNVKKAKKKIFLRSVKVLKLFDNVMFHATTESEKKEIHKVFGEVLPIKVAANLSQKTNTPILHERIKQAGSLKLVNIARIAPEKNLLYALEVLKLVKGNVQFDIYGPIYNEEYWNKCQQIIKQLPDNIKTEYKGIIEQNSVLEVLNKYHFVFMPSTGENFGHIILQSLTVGVPVIISDKTRWKQLKEKNIGWDIVLDKISEFAETIDSAAIINQLDYNKMSEAAFHYAQQYNNNPELIEQNRHLFI